MRDDEIRRLLRERNPWWRLRAGGLDPTGWVSMDPVLHGARQAGIDYRPGVLDDVTPGGLWVLRGPRRVGKSVELKRLAARFCANPDRDPFALVYLSVDDFKAQDLRRAFTLGRELTTAAGTRPRIWLIDEITAVEGWTLIVKELRDNTPLAFDGLVLTGSSATDLDEARRALGAGRTGVPHPFRILLPMAFRDRLRVTGSNTPLPDATGPDALQTPEAAAAVARLAPFVDDLDLSWQRHLDVGGFPRAVGEAHRDGDVSATFVADMLSWLATDVTPDEPVESVHALLSELHRRSGNPLELRGTAEALGTTRDRLRARLHRLVATFGAFWCDQGDDAGRQVTSSQPKLYLLDPLLARLPHLRDPTAPDPDATRLTEAALALELARAIDRLHPDRFVEQRAIRYARTGGGREIDFAPVPVTVAATRTTTCPVEAKWVSRNWRSQALPMRGRYQRGVVATKDVIDVDNAVWAIPAPILALLLN